MTGNPIPLNDFITLQRGHDLPHKNRVEGNVPVVASTGIAGYHNEAKAKAPGVILGRSGSIGGGQYITEDYWPLNTTLWVKDFKGHNERFIYYLLKSIDFSSFNVGSGVPTLNRNHLSSILIDDKGRQFEDKVAKILGDIDDKIAVNIQINQTLEQIAQAIFKSWFVDFDPVKAKIEALAAGGNADDAELAAMSVISAKTVDELNSLKASNPEAFNKLAQTAALFPAAMQDSELGEIPEGWEIGTLESHTSMIIDHRGKTPKKLGSDWVKDGYPAISAKNIKSKKIVRSDTIRFIDEVTYKKWMKEPLIKGDIIMTSEAPMGELYFFDGSQNFCLSQRLYGLRANSEVCSSEFLFNWLQTTKAQADMEGRASGTTALGIKQAELRKVKILTPPRELLETYSLVASNLVDMAANNNAQNTVLADMRDTLLPKLLAGEIDLTSEVVE